MSTSATAAMIIDKWPNATTGTLTPDVVNGYASEDDDDEVLSKNSESYGSNNPASKRPSADVIAKDEDKAVIRLRLLLVLVLIGSTIGAAFATHHYVSGFETSSFEEQFQADASKVLSSIGASLDLTMAAVDTLAVTMVSYAHSSQSNWPFVTVPDFAVRAAKIRTLSHAIFLSVYPLVTLETRFEWENYTVGHDYWVNETLALQEKDESCTGPINFNWTQQEDLGVITDSFGPRPYNMSTSTYLPQWQNYPVVTTSTPYNWDLLSATMIPSFEAVFGSQKVIISAAYQLPDPDDPVEVEEAEFSTLFFSDFTVPGQDPSEPISEMYYPIVDSAVSSLWTPSDPEDENNKLVGILALSIFWADAIKEVRT